MRPFESAAILFVRPIIQGVEQLHVIGNKKNKCKVFFAVAAEAEEPRHIAVEFDTLYYVVPVICQFRVILARKQR